MAEQQTVRMDFTKYTADRDRGIVKVAKLSDTSALIFKKVFHTDDGAELEPTTTPVSVSMLLGAKQVLQANIAGIDALLADMAALGIDISPAQEAA